MSQFIEKSSVFEPEYLEGFRLIYEEKVVFNHTLGLKLVSVTPEEVVARIDMRPELVGHYAYNRIHGGVISAVLDAIGSAAVMACLAAKHMKELPAERLERFAKLGTIDLRVPTRSALASTSPFMPMRCAWARAWVPRAWSFAGPMAP